MQSQFSNDTGLSTSLLLGAASLMLSVGSLIVDQPVAKLVGGASAIFGFGYVSYNEKKRQPFLEQLRDLSNIEQNQRKQNLLLGGQDFQALASAQTKKEEKPLSYETVTPEDVFSNSPHIMIDAPTGSGKSTFINWILNAYLHEDALLFLNPHATEGITVESMEHGINLLAQLREGKINRLVVGHNRDYESLYNIYQALGDDNSGEIAYRFSHGGEEANHRYLNIVIDELPSQIFALEKIEKGLVPSTLQKFLLESRKINMRLISSVQGDQVSLWGGKGASSLKSAYTHVKLGLSALRLAAQQGNTELEEVLTKDFQASKTLHAKLQKAKTSKQMFKGTCWLVDGKYLKFRNVSAYNIPIQSDLLDPEDILDCPVASQNNQASKQPQSNDQTESTGVNLGIEHAHIAENTPHISLIRPTDQPSQTDQTEASILYQARVATYGMPIKPPPSYYARLRANQPTDQTESTADQTPDLTETKSENLGEKWDNLPATKNSPTMETKVEVKGLKSYWVARYEDSPSYDHLQAVRPKFVTNQNLEKFFELRGEKLSHSKSVAKMFGGEKYKTASSWLKEVYDLVAGV